MSNSLDEFRAQILLNVRAALEKKTAIEKTKSTVRSTIAISNADSKRLQLLKAEEQWYTESVLITGQHQYCSSCGHDALCTTGTYYVQHHKALHAQRLKATQSPNTDLPVRRALDQQDLVVSICANCALDDDGPVAQLLYAAARTAPFITNQLSLF